MKLSLRVFFILSAVLALSVVHSTARDNGITGQYQNGCGGGACHGGAANNNTVLTLTGPTTVKAGQSGNYTFRVAHNDQDAAGLNIAFLAPAGGPSGTLVAGAGARVTATQITHNEGKDFDGNNGADFTFSWTAPEAHGLYTFAGAGNAVNNANGNAGDIWNTMSQQITVTGATVTAPTGGSYCQGASITIKWTHTGMTNLRIEMSPDNYTTVYTIATTVAANDEQLVYTIPADQDPATTYTLRLVDTRTGDELDRSSGFAISGSPEILTQPEATDVCVGRTFQLTVGATGSEPVYQWRKDGQNINGATTGVLRITTANAADEGSYDCVITACDQTVTSNAVTVTVKEPPVIEAHPQGAQLCEGERVELAVDAVGSDLTYQWLLNGVPISGETARTLTIPAVALGQEGVYQCRITGSCSPQRTTDSAVIDVLLKPTIEQQPQGADLTAGDDLNLSVTAGGEALEYQWFKDGDPIEGAAGATLNIQGVVRADSGIYSVRVRNKCDSTDSEQARVTVAPASGPGIFVLGVDAINLGDFPMCATADTVVSGLLKNEGGTAITVTMATVDPAANIEVLDQDFPVTIEAGSSLPISIRVSPNGAGPVSGSITFAEASGDQSVSISATAVEVAAASPDTLMFPDKSSGEQRCVTTIEVACPEMVITEVAFDGPGAAAFELAADVALPVTVVEGETADLCVVTTAEGADPAVMTVTTTAGAFSVDLVREVVSSVDEEDRTVINGLVVAPNPMRDDVMISSPRGEEMHVRVYSTMGSAVSHFNGVGEIRWDGRDSSGARLATGLYVLVIEQGFRTQVVKLLLE